MQCKTVFLFCSMKQRSGGKGWQGQFVGQASPNIQVCFIPAFSPVIVLVIFSFAVVCAFKLLGISVLSINFALLKDLPSQLINGAGELSEHVLL